VFVGAILIIVGWFTPWYNSLTWAPPRSGLRGLTNAGYQFTNLARGDYYAKWGLGAWSKTFTGPNLLTGPAVLRPIAFSRTDFYTWIALAALALIAIWTYERPHLGSLTTTARRRIYLVFESAKVILLVLVVAECLWKAFDLTNKAMVNRLAEKALYGSTLPSGSHFVTNYSFGLTVLPLGVIFAALGVLSGDRAPEVKFDADGNAVTVASKVRVKAWVMAVIALFFMAVAYALFD
jgi:hypothetical protein